jgi:signal peptidase I
MWPNASMSDAPEPPRPLRWPHAPGVGNTESEAVTDPDGRWMAESSEPDPAPTTIRTISVIFRDSARWAPQHGAFGRSDSALPGAFFPLELEPAGSPAPPGFLEPEAVAEAQERTSSNRSTVAREILETVLLAMLVFLAVRASVHHYRVEGQSMDPTLADGEFLLVNSLIYSEVNIDKVAKWVPYWDPGEPDVRHVFHGPERGDIIVFEHPQSPDRDLVKRVIGVPGDRIAIRGGVVYIDDLQLIEPYVAFPWQHDMPEMLIPEDQYFVMGDNRGNSLDSRNFGPIEGDLIVGKALGSWWPRDHIGLAPNADPQLVGPPASEAD